MREDHTYFIIDRDSITEDQKYKAKNQVFRESTAGEYLVQVKGNVDSCYNGLTSYTYSQIVEELKQDKWLDGIPTLEELKSV